MGPADGRGSLEDAPGVRDRTMKVRERDEQHRADENESPEGPECTDSRHGTRADEQETEKDHSDRDCAVKTKVENGLHTSPPHDRVAENQGKIKSLG
jgi:hypothetical protein